MSRRSCRDVCGVTAPSIAHVCDPPCLSMLHNAPVEHCVAEAFIPVLNQNIECCQSVRLYLMSHTQCGQNLRSYLRPVSMNVVLSYHAGRIFGISFSASTSSSF